jgi:phage FluMu protein Com
LQLPESSFPQKGIKDGVKMMWIAEKILWKAMGKPVKCGKTIGNLYIKEETNDQYGQSCTFSQLSTPYPQNVDKWIKKIKLKISKRSA